MDLPSPPSLNQPSRLNRRRHFVVLHRRTVPAAKTKSITASGLGNSPPVASTGVPSRMIQGELRMKNKTSARPRNSGTRSGSRNAGGHPSIRGSRMTSRRAGQGGRRQQAGGPDHRGLNADEDRNP